MLAQFKALTPNKNTYYGVGNGAIFGEAITPSLCFISALHVNDIKISIDLCCSDASYTTVNCSRNVSCSAANWYYKGDIFEV